jgi:hypothetical protein
MYTDGGKAVPAARDQYLTLKVGESSGRVFRWHPRGFARPGSCARRYVRARDDAKLFCLANSRKAYEGANRELVHRPRSEALDIREPFGFRGGRTGGSGIRPL